MITFEELSQRFPVQNVAPYGECVVVPGAEFDPDWEVYLGDQGCRVVMTDLDGRPVTLVQRKNVSCSQVERVVYAPPQEKEALPNCVFCLSSNVKKDGLRRNKTGDLQCFLCGDCGRAFARSEDFGFKMKHSNKIIQFAQQLASQTDPAYSLRDIAEEIERRFGVKVSHVAIGKWLEPEKKGGDNKNMESTENKKSGRWTEEQDALLVKTIGKCAYGRNQLIVAALKEGKFPGRMLGGCMQRYDKIPQAFKEKVLSAKEPAQSDKSAPSAAVASLGDVKTLFEAYDALSKAYVELKADFDKQMAFIYPTLAENNEAIKDLQSGLRLHKHAVGSGEAMLPMEASS